ncbi:rab9 effector protein with kelch motifs-like isoform X2 [Orbicella faveolata]|uniref:rab9 effector protein with kelch motifs-like isoform X2 n=1 Tax=Orbicella faveolata TaxID=48498 RepID=UPI0009E1DB50|nr:rab9 effector protein with kelch motifs-like isoform X2 [Orbicella faveolata]
MSFNVVRWIEGVRFQNGGRRGGFRTSLEISNPMEVLPILESNNSPKPNVWYVLSPEGEAPCIRVGHTCTFVGGEPRRVLVIGGANPDGSFADVYSLDLEKGKWETVETCGSPPSPRTCHNMVSIGSKFFVFGGGLSGPDPVPDTTVHVFNAEDSSWSQPDVSGSLPCARHGHVSVAVGTDIYIHGGMAGTNIFDDVYKFNTVSHTWSKLQPRGSVPSSRTAHAAACVGKKIFIHGGMSSIGTALDDMFSLDTETLRWTRTPIDGPSPAPRLDHTLCTVEIPKPTDDSASEKTKADESLTILLVFGGMDTQGEIFNDCLVLMPENMK